MKKVEIGVSEEVQMLVSSREQEPLNSLEWLEFLRPSINLKYTWLSSKCEKVPTARPLYVSEKTERRERGPFSRTRG